jgi:hypothetical protein
MIPNSVSCGALSRKSFFLPELTLRLFVAAMEVVRDKMASKAQDLKLYLEVLDPAHEAKPRKSKEKHLMIFVKYFNFSDQTLTGVGHFYVHQNARVGEVIPLINARMYFPKNTSLKLYEVRVLFSISIMRLSLICVGHLITTSIANHNDYILPFVCLKKICRAERTATLS